MMPSKRDTAKRRQRKVKSKASTPAADTPQPALAYPEPRRRLPARTLTGRSEGDDLGVKAARAFQQAHVTKHRPAFDRFDAMSKSREAERTHQEAQALMRPEGTLLRGSGEAAIAGSLTGLTREQRAIEIYIIDTLEEPNMVSLGASQLRMEAAAKLGILQPALDTAATAQASNSIEKMLCHQMAALHHHAMGMLARATGAGELRDADPNMATRYTNAATRLMETYQNGALALMKLKTGGKQTVVVQHVHVSDGGQAVIAGNVNKGGKHGTGGGEPK